MYVNYRARSAPVFQRGYSSLVTFYEEIKRIQKTIEKLEKDTALLHAKLSNEKFVQNADEDVIAADRVLLQQSSQQILSLREALTRFI